MPLSIGAGSWAPATSWVSECVITYDGVPTHSLSVMEITDGLVTHETQYFADPFDAPPERAAGSPARDVSRAASRSAT